MSESFDQYETVEHYETVLKHIHDGVYTLDANGQITWVNETAVDQFDIGYERQDLIGAPVSKVLNDEDVEKCLRIIQRCLESDDRDSGRCEIALQTAYGTEIPCDLHLGLLPVADGEFQGTVGVVRDISDRKRREQQLEVQNRVLRHNLRNDMNVILGLITELETAVEDGHERELQTLRERAEELLELAEKLQALSNIHEWGSGDHVSVDIMDQIEFILDEFRAEHPTVEVEYSATGDDALDWKVTSRELFEVAIRNLLENSIEHNDSSTPKVSIEVTSEAGHGSIRIEDNGPGLPEMERRVLEHGSESALQHSSGVGLWLVHWCISGLGGDVRFAETSAAGTVVTVEMPIGPTDTN